MMMETLITMLQSGCAALEIICPPSSEAFPKTVRPFEFVQIRRSLGIKGDLPNIDNVSWEVQILKDSVGST